jgi:hypothetical protein
VIQRRRVGVGRVDVRIALSGVGQRRVSFL